MIRKRTGQTCEMNGNYRFDGYTDGTRSPAPTAEEQVIPMDIGDTFPPISSQDKAAWWRWFAA